MQTILISAAAAVALMLTPVTVTAAEGGQFVIIINDHKFEPAEVRVPAGKQIELVVENRDTTPEEFESHELRREKIIPGGGKVSIRIGPLKKGVYSFVGEFHEATAKGKIIAE